MTTRSPFPFALAVSIFALACSGSGSIRDPNGEASDAGDEADVACTYDPPTDDPRCAKAVQGATCDAPLTCLWPGYGDCPAVGCCAPKSCRCFVPIGADAGPGDGMPLGGSPSGTWQCAQ